MENPNTPEFWDNYYRKLSQSYGSYEEGQVRYLLVFEEIKKHLKDNIKILDLGCGNGYISSKIYSYVLKKGYKVDYTGIDFSEEGIEIAKIHSPRLNFNVANLNDYEIEKNYDIIFLFDILEHLSNPHKILKKAIECGKIILINSPYKGEIQALDHINKIDMDFFEEYFGKKREICFRIFNTPDGRSFIVVMKND